MTNTPNKRLPPVAVMLVLHTVQLVGAILVLTGLCLVFDVGGLASVMGLTADHENGLVGGVLAFAGFLDLVVVPRFLNARFNPKI